MQNKIDILKEELKVVFENNGKTCPDFQENMLLDASFGLDSLDWAEFAVRFEKRTGRDLFVQAGAPLKTFKDLMNLVDR